MKHFATAFFGHYLQGKSEYRDYFSEDSSSLSGRPFVVRASARFCGAEAPATGSKDALRQAAR